MGKRGGVQRKVGIGEAGCFCGGLEIDPVVGARRTGSKGQARELAIRIPTSENATRMAPT